MELLLIIVAGIVLIAATGLGVYFSTRRSGEASTEDLRLAFQRYRSFFSRLLSL